MISLRFYEKANDKREESTSNVERPNDDVIEYLSFGSYVLEL